MSKEPFLDIVHKARLEALQKRKDERKGSAHARRKKDKLKIKVR